MIIKIVDHEIDVNELTKKLISPKNGGVDIFIGNIRKMTGEIETQKLVYSTYKSMAIKEMTKLAQRYEDQGFDVIMVHRVGELQLGEVAVFIGVAAPHRAEAFEACRFLIDNLKRTVPIWKKEFDTDKIRWGDL